MFTAAVCVDRRGGGERGRDLRSTSAPVSPPVSASGHGAVILGLVLPDGRGEDARQQADYGYSSRVAGY